MYTHQPEAALLFFLPILNYSTINTNQVLSGQVISVQSAGG
jgi:hypothetical protein